jgi:hypothetical protein
MKKSIPRIRASQTFLTLTNFGHVHSAYNPSFLAGFFSRNSIFLSQQISQQYFSAGLSAQPNGSFIEKSINIYDIK